MVSRKSVVGNVTLNLCFYIRRDVQVTLWILMRPVRETWMHYFSDSGGSGKVSRKIKEENITPN
jgi:hypothetical protein